MPSNVKTIQDYATDTESEIIPIRKKQLDEQMKKLHLQIKTITNENIENKGEKRVNDEKLQICLEEYQKMKIERDKMKQQLKQLQEINEKMKNHHKPVENYSGFDGIISNVEMEKEVDKFVKGKKKDIEEWRKKMFEQ